MLIVLYTSGGTHNSTFNISIQRQTLENDNTLLARSENRKSCINQGLITEEVDGCIFVSVVVAENINVAGAAGAAHEIRIVLNHNIIDHRACHLNLCLQVS